MDKKEFKKRGKGLLALLLAMIMMFGSSMTVLAATIDLNVLTGNGLTENQILHGGDTISCYSEGSGGSLTVTIDENTFNISHTGYYFFKYQLPAGKDYKVIEYSPNVSGQQFRDCKYIIKLQSIASSTSDSGSSYTSSTSDSGSSYKHEHYFEWVETIEPTETSDGLMEHKCACGAVDDSYVISGAMAFVKNIVKMIQEAPENGTVEITTDYYTCYTSYILKELIKRPDVSLKTTYKDKDGNARTFTIPAGQAPTDGAQFYGFTYLGNLYGWN